MAIDSDRRRLALGACLVFGAILSIGIDLGDFHCRQTSDSLVPVLSSLYRWTPYYWECNRLGMFVPLLAMPFHNPLHNLLVQTWLVLFATFAAIFLLPAYLLRSFTLALSGVIGSSLFFLLLPKDWSFYFTFGQPAYPVALALGLAGLMRLTSPAGRPSLSRVCQALVLSLLAHWVNLAATMFLGPLVILRGMGRPRHSGGRSIWPNAEAIYGFVVLLVGSAGGALLPRVLLHGTSDPVRMGILPPGQWLESWAKLASNTWAAVVMPHSGWYLALAISAVVSLHPAISQDRLWATLKPAMILVGAAAIFGLLAGTLNWVAMNGFHCRYWLPLVFFLQAALAILVTGPIAALLNGSARRAASLGAAAVLAGGLLLTFGTPSIARVRADLNRLPHDVPLAVQTADLLATRATHIIGSYAQVWVSVFHANLVLHEQGSSRIIWGVTGRSLPTWDLWGRFPPEDLRIAVLPEVGESDREARAYKKCFFPPLSVVEERPTLTLLRPSEIMELSSKKRRETAVVRYAWYQGFSGFPIVRGRHWLWGGSSGKLDLTNPSDHTCTVTLAMQLSTTSSRPARLFVDGGLFSDEVALSGPPQDYMRTLAVPPGRHIVSFACDGPAVPIPGMWGARFVFSVTDFRLIASLAPTSRPGREREAVP
jgi:hypothetical protein